MKDKIIAKKICVAVGRAVNNGSWFSGYYWTNECGNHFIRVTKNDHGCIISPKDIEIHFDTLRFDFAIRYVHVRTV